MRQGGRKKWRVYGLVILALCTVMLWALKDKKEQKTERGRAIQSCMAETAKIWKTEDWNVMDLKAGTVIERAGWDDSPTELGRWFTAVELDEKILTRISGKSYQDNPDINPDGLRYLKVLHYNYDHQVQVGELIVNEKLAEEVLDIFRQLFAEEYEIESMRLIDDFWTGDGSSADEASIQANNSSAFCYRVIAGRSVLSRHAYGCAIDINPLQNPFVVYTNGVPAQYPAYSGDYVARTPGRKHVIDREDACCRIFKAHGFIWGGDWETPKDYQHFEKRGI